jgi:ubiquinone/menaquinone biosynthesis C-methylase UbiE
MAWFSRRRKQTQTAGEPAQGRRFLWLGGRRHVADAPYVLPSDDQEINRLDFQHYMLRFALRGNYAAPISQPASILDVGGGTGRWAIEMAQLFPNANVVNTDLVPPKGSEGGPGLGSGAERVPENYAFVQGNVLEGLPFADNSFDFVHVRLLLFAISKDKWPAVAREVLRVTRPGGWVESVETGPQRNGGPAMDMLVQWITEASMRRGVDPLLGPHIAKYYADAGLSRVQTRDINLPVGQYGGRLGNMAAVDVFGVVGGIKQVVVAQNITDAPSYDSSMSQARDDLNRFQCTLPFYLAYGQKSR